MENEQSQPQPQTKRSPIVAILIVVALIAVGGFVWYRNGGFQTAAPSDESASNANSIYKNDQYNFTFVLPPGNDAHVKEDTLRQTTYLGLPVDFFVSVRDLVKDAKPTNLAFFYAAKGLTVDAFKAALEASDPANVKVTSTEDVTENDITMTKIVSTTASGDTKTHYLFPSGDAMVIVSVFLQEDEAFAPILSSFRHVK